MSIIDSKTLTETKHHIQNDIFLLMDIELNLPISKDQSGYLSVSCTGAKGDKTSLEYVNNLEHLLLNGVI